MTVCFWELSGKSVRQGISRCSDRFESVDSRIIGQSRSLGPALTDPNRVAFSKVVQLMPLSQFLTDYRENFSPGQAGEKDSDHLYQWEAPVSGIKVGLAEQKRLCRPTFPEVTPLPSVRESISTLSRPTSQKIIKTEGQIPLTMRIKCVYTQGRKAK